MSLVNWALSTCHTKNENNQRPLPPIVIVVVGKLWVARQGMGAGFLYKKQLK